MPASYCGQTLGEARQGERLRAERDDDLVSKGVSTFAGEQHRDNTVYSLSWIRQAVTGQLAPSCDAVARIVNPTLSDRVSQ